MKTKHRNNRRKKGFSLAETLLVVAILIILTGLVCIAVIKYQRNLKLVELDGIAKEIFVAAQNNISLASGQAYLGREEETETIGAYFSEETAESAAPVNYFVVGSNYAALTDSGSILGLILPANSIDETVRTGGSYIIRFQRRTGTILDVFYSEKSGKYAHTMLQADYDELMGIRGSKDERKNYTDAKAVIGYYGGVTPREVLPDSELLPPLLSVSNGDTLSVTVTNPNALGKISKLELVVRGKDSGLENTIVLFDAAGGTEVASYTEILDAITDVGLHFGKKFPGFIPGEDISLKAVILADNGTKRLESAVSETNSLFAYKNESEAGISSIRHLENLDPRISGLSGSEGSRIVDSAKQLTNLSWKTFSHNYADSVIFYDGTAAADGFFVPVVPDYSLDYNGSGRTVSEVVAKTNGDAGLFGAMDHGGSISDLFLVDFDIQSLVGNAGALAGRLANVSVSGVLAYNEKTSGSTDEALEITASGNAGGLVGLMTSGRISAGAAAVYVASESGNAGGLIGSAYGVASVQDCYSGGHTVDARFQDNPDGAGRVNVQAMSGKAGGLIGYAENSAVSYSYSTCSVIGGLPGGLVGGISDGSVTSCYVTGRVSSADSSPVGPFAGEYSGASFSGTNYYLNNMSSGIKSDVIPNVTGVSGKDTSFVKLILPEESRTIAYLYDSSLEIDYKGCFYFPTIEQWHMNVDGNAGSLVSKPGITDFHHGDFQIPSLDSLGIVLCNGDTLYLDVALEKLTESGANNFTVAVTGLSSDNTKLFLVSLAGATPVIEDAGVLNGDTIEWSSVSGAGLIPVPVELSSAGDHLFMTFDDITSDEAHFTQLFTDCGLIPGEDISVCLATGRCNWSDLKELEEMGCSVSDNSLFAQRNTAYTSLANIKTVRHLQNLDPVVSDVSQTITRAALLNNIDWTSVASGYSSVYSADGTTHTDGFYALYNSKLTSFSGNNRTLSNFVFKAPASLKKGGADTAYAGNAGLFRAVTGSMTVSDLRLDECSALASGNGNAGGIAGYVAGSGNVTVDTVLVSAEVDFSNVSGSDCVKAAGTGSAGGIIGCSEISGSLKLENSAATILVSASGSAGGLIGSQNGGAVTISKSYAGGHTFETSYGHGVYDVTSASSAAGGLIGFAQSGSGLTVRDSFSAASVSAADDKPAGGLIGQSGENTLLNTVYSIAPVRGLDIYDGERTAAYQTHGALIGQMTSGTLSPDCDKVFYLGEVYEEYDGDKNVTTVGQGPYLECDPAYYAKDSSDISAKYPDAITKDYTLQSETYSYDSDLTDREFPYSIWTDLPFGSRYEPRSSSSGFTYGTYFGDWQPILPPQSVTATLIFTYRDPLTGNLESLAAETFGTQTLVVGQENHIVLPAEPHFNGYYVVKFELYLDDVLLGECTPSGGSLTISAASAGSYRVEIKYAENTVPSTECSIAFMFDAQGRSGASASYEQLGTTKVYSAAHTWAEVKNLVTPRVIVDYQFAGWFKDAACETPWEDVDPIAWGSIAYAKYDKIEYYYVSIDFMYAIIGDDEEATPAYLSSIPRYNLDSDAGQIRIKQPAGRSYNGTVKLPPCAVGGSALTFREIVADFATPEEEYPGASIALTSDESGLSIQADRDTHFIVTYIFDESRVPVADEEMCHVRIVDLLRKTQYVGGQYVYGSDDYYAYPLGTDTYYHVYLDIEGEPQLPDIDPGEYDNLYFLTEALVEKDPVGTERYFDLVRTYDRRQYQLFYNTRGGMYLEAKTLYAGTPLNAIELSTPTRTGYAFSRWSDPYMRTDNTELVAGGWDSGVMPARNIETGAVWIGDSEKYTVKIYKQNVSDAVNAADSAKNYILSKSEVFSAGASGYSIKVVDGVTYAYIPEDSTLLTPLPGFHLNTVNSVLEAELKDDGNTTLHVRFDRNAITIKVLNTTYIGLYGAEFPWTFGTSTTYVLDKYGMSESTAATWNGNQFPITIVPRFAPLMPFMDPDTRYFSLKKSGNTNREIEIVLAESETNLRNKIWVTSYISNCPNGADFVALDLYEEYEFWGYSDSKNGGSSSWYHVSLADCPAKPFKVAYTRRLYSWNIVYLTQTPTGYVPVRTDTTQNVPYGADISIARSDLYIPDGYIWEEDGFYKDQACTEHLGSFPIPLTEDGFTIYVKLIPHTQSVKFELNDPSTEYFANAATSVPANNSGVSSHEPDNYYWLDIFKGYAFDGIITNENGLLPEYVPTNVDDSYVFSYWYYTEDGVNVRYYPSLQINKDIVLHPKWEKIQDDTYRPVTVHYLLLNEDGTATPVAEDFNGSYMCGKVATFTAVELHEYYALGSILQEYIPYPEEGEDPIELIELTFYYRPVQTWHYSMEYYVRYSSYLAPEAGMPGGYDIESPETSYMDFKVGETLLKESYYGYETVMYAPPDGFTNYRLACIEFENTDSGEVAVVKGDNLCIVNPGEDAYAETLEGTEISAKVRFYLEPDTAFVKLADRNLVYDGDSADAVYVDNSSGLAAPDGCSIRVINACSFFDASGENAADSTIDLGAYRMEGNVILEVTDTAAGVTKYFLIFKDDSKEAVMRRTTRPVTVLSASAAKTRSDDPDKPLVESDFIMPTTMIAIPEDVAEFGTELEALREKFPQIDSYLGQTAWYAFGEGDDEYKSDILLIGPSDGKTPIVHDVRDSGTDDDGLEVLFSVEAFRLGAGSADNSFTYVLKDNTAARDFNYMLTVVFGTLTVE